MNRIIIVPDVHGRSFWRIVLDNKKDRIIFLGDYSDPYPQEDFTHEDALRELADIIEFKKNNPERVILLWGNHDVHYLNYNWACWRFSKKHYEQYHQLYAANYDLFQIAYEVEIKDQPYLFTHAGLSPEWYNLHHKELSEADTMVDILNLTWKQNPNVFNTIGRYRGGLDIGSPIWADIREHDPHFLISKQIFGHSQQESEPILSKGMNCLDCRRVFILENENINEYKNLNMNDTILHGY